MQRDMKIGMALGVALVGIVGALFFRREPELKDKEAPPPLQSAEELDREIAGRAKAPYIKGLEEFDNAAAPVPPPASSANPSTKSKEELKQREAAGRKPATAPDPIQPAKADALANDQVPVHNRDWEPQGAPGSGGEKGGKKAGESGRLSPAGTNIGTNRTHVIQAGETLSALASRYLGSSARYREIYEANRSVLRSPDDVREGLSITIPDSHAAGTNSPVAKPGDSRHVAESHGGGQSATGHSGTKAQKASSRTVKSDAGKSDGGKSDKSDAGRPVQDAAEPASDRPRERIRFVPVPHGPFSAGRVSAQGTSKPDSRKGATSGDSIEENE